MESGRGILKVQKALLASLDDTYIGGYLHESYRHDMDVPYDTTVIQHNLKISVIYKKILQPQK